MTLVRRETDWKNSLVVPTNEIPKERTAFTGTAATRRPPSTWNVLELGSGTGAVGLFAAGLGVFQSVHLTEHRPPMTAAIPSVPYNVDGNLDFNLFRDTTVGGEGVMARSNRLLDLLEYNTQLNQDIMTDTNGQPLSSSWPPTILELDWAVPEHSQRILESLSSSITAEHNMKALNCSWQAISRIFQNCIIHWH